mmetsp:Transcript_22771/g.27925  ORF Transcript_22771/g.27925 Transcript_22771/m.27925 type:complete len:175 (+) Transcript_22771:43-567(+)
MSNPSNIPLSSLSQLARQAVQDGEEHYKNKKTVVDPNSNHGTANQKSIFVAKEFLEKASPTFLKSDIAKDDDRFVKVGRSVQDLVSLSSDDGDEKGEEVLKMGLQNVVEQCDILALGDLKLPKVRFGKTEIQMPIATLGCMRFQQTWAKNIDSMDKVNPKVQENMFNIFLLLLT